MSTTFPISAPSEPRSTILPHGAFTRNARSARSEQMMSVGSHTIVENPPSPDDGSTVVGMLSLVGDTSSERRIIHWREDVVDNEGVGKKSSKGT